MLCVINVVSLFIYQLYRLNSVVLGLGYEYQSVKNVEGSGRGVF
jgi:hypothetical protein